MLRQVISVHCIHEWYGSYAWQQHLQDKYINMYDLTSFLEIKNEYA